MCPMQLPMVPVLIHLAPQDDDIALAELEVAGFLSLLTVERLPIGKLGKSLKGSPRFTRAEALPYLPGLRYNNSTSTCH